MGKRLTIEGNYFSFTIIKKILPIIFSIRLAPILNLFKILAVQGLQILIGLHTKDRKKKHHYCSLHFDLN